jgi:glutamate-ammonia-ligase adenylyltransferase
MDAVRAVLSRPRDAHAVRRDIRAMRALVAQEKPAHGPFDLKLVPGGFVDIEFAAQALQLIHASGAAQVLSPNTGEALSACRAGGFVPEADAAALIAAWRLQSALAPLIALSGQVPFEPEQAREPFRKRLAAAAGLPDYRILVRELAEVQAAAHAALARVLRG